MKPFHETYSIWVTGETAPRQSGIQSWLTALSDARSLAYRERVETEVMAGWDNRLLSYSERGCRFDGEASR